MKALVGLLSDRTVLRSKMEGPRPDKFTLTRLDFCGNLSQQLNITYFYIFVLAFPTPFRRRFPALLLRVIAGYPMQTVMRFSRCGAGFGNKKSPHNDLNLTIPSGIALVRVRYVAIRKSKTCSGSFGSRAGTLNKYVILNCWNRLPHKSSRVNKKF